MAKFDVIVTDRFTGKSYVHDTYPSRSLANEAAYFLKQSNHDGLYTIQVVAQLPPKKNRKANPCGCRKPNPVPPSHHVQRRDAADLYKRFTGHEALEEVKIDKPVLPDVMLVVGDIDGIMYTTVRDGVVEKYVHQFKKKARPLFCVSHDGKQIHLIGGEYDFTERGIVDRT